MAATAAAAAALNAKEFMSRPAKAVNWLGVTSGATVGIGAIGATVLVAATAGIDIFVTVVNFVVAFCVVLNGVDTFIVDDPAVARLVLFTEVRELALSDEGVLILVFDFVAMDDNVLVLFRLETVVNEIELFVVDIGVSTAILDSVETYLLVSLTISEIMVLPKLPGVPITELWLKVVFEYGLLEFKSSFEDEFMVLVLIESVGLSISILAFGMIDWLIVFLYFLDKSSCSFVWLKPTMV